MDKGNIIHAPNSIYHGMLLHDPKRLPLSDTTLMRIEIGQLTDFIEFLFEHSEHCDHISQKDAWKEFKIFEAKNSLHREKIKQERAKMRSEIK